MPDLPLTSGEPLLLDVTRLLSRLPNKGLTGVDRVERAWLRFALAREWPCLFLIRTRWGFLLLGRDGGAALLQMVEDVPDQSPPTNTDARVSVEARSIGRCARFGLRFLLRQHGLLGGVYLNTGHSNLTGSVLRACKASGLSVVVLVHDTLPLDHPEWARAGTVPKFQRKMQAVARYADRVIHTAQATRATTEAQFDRLGRVPHGVVAPLGLDLAVPDASLPQLGLADGDPFYVSVGTLEPRKNHALLIDLWGGLAQDLGIDALPTLVLAGRKGWLTAQDWDRIAGNPLFGRKILHVPGLSDGAIAALYQRANALLMPSFAEGYGLPPLEAAARGCPVFAADLPVYRETLGAFPVYLNPSDMYLWKAKINQQLAGSGPKRGLPPENLPVWQTHYELALPELAKPGNATPEDRNTVT